MTLRFRSARGSFFVFCLAVFGALALDARGETVIRNPLPYEYDLAYGATVEDIFAGHVRRLAIPARGIRSIKGPVLVDFTYDKKIYHLREDGMYRVGVTASHTDFIIEELSFLPGNGAEGQVEWHEAPYDAAQFNL